MTADKRQQIDEANARREKAERATLHDEIRLAIARDRISAHEIAEARRQTNQIQAAVKRMVKSGDHAGEFTMAAQFNADPELIPLALSRRICRPGQNRR